MNKTVNKNLIREDEGKQKVTAAYQRRHANRCPDKHSLKLAKAMENIVRLVKKEFQRKKFPSVNPRRRTFVDFNTFSITPFITCNYLALQS